MEGSECLATVFGPAASVPFEGGSVLSFDLCELRWGRQARRLGIGQIPLSLVTQHVSISAESAKPGKQFEVKVHDVQHPTRAIASMSIKLGIRTQRLEDVGGHQSLKEHELPVRPYVDDNRFLDLEDVEMCTTYYKQVLLVKQSLLEAYKDITLGDTRADGKLKQKPPTRPMLWRPRSALDNFDLFHKSVTWTRFSFHGGARQGALQRCQVDTECKSCIAAT
jgi:hypothetical protein